MWRPPPRNGFSLTELLFALGLAATVAGAAVPALLSALDDHRALGAVRYLATRFQRVRMEAVSRRATTAIRFTQTGGTHSFAVFVDGNGDGVKSLDIDRGIDRRTTAEERLSDHFRGVEFGVLPGLSPVDSSAPAPTADPIRFGVVNAVSFTPVGTATPGSVYVLGGHEQQYVISVFGETGKTRILYFNKRRGAWEPR